MNDLCKIELFNFLKDDLSTVTNHEMQHAYENFMNQVRSIIQSDTNFPEIYRLLNMTCIEFQSLQTQLLYEQGEKCV